MRLRLLGIGLLATVLLCAMVPMAVSAPHLLGPSTAAPTSAPTLTQRCVGIVSLAWTRLHSRASSAYHVTAAPTPIPPSPYHPYI